MTPEQLVRTLDETLGASFTDDVAINGLQVDGPAPCRTVGTAVTLTSRIVDDAVRLKVDTLLVHHGILWRGVAAPIIGAAHRRLHALMTNGVSLIAYHLPLDSHPTLGNSVQLLSQVSGCAPEEGAFHRVPDSAPWVWRWTVDRPLTAGPDTIGPFTIRAATPEGLALAAGGARTVTVATGKGDSCASATLGLGDDLFVTGELSLQAFEAAADEGRAVVCVGHHDSETGGVVALGDWIRHELELTVHHLRSACPV